MTGRRLAGVWGWAFVVLLLVYGGMASVPGGEDATSTIRDFYAQHRGVVLVAQAVGFFAAAMFVPFTLTLRRTPDLRAMGVLELAGLVLAAVACVTALPVLWLTVVADRGSRDLVHASAVASDLVDVALFAVIAFWAAALFQTTRPRWFRLLAGVLAAVSAARAVLLLLGSHALEVVAPTAFLGLVALLSTLVLVRRSPVAGRGGRRSTWPPDPRDGQDG